MLQDIEQLQQQVLTLRNDKQEMQKVNSNFAEDSKRISELEFELGTFNDQIEKLEKDHVADMEDAAQK